MLEGHQGKLAFFQAPFPTGVLNANVSSVGSSGHEMSVYSVSKTSITVSNRNNVSQNACWIAIGY